MSIPRAKASARGAVLVAGALLGLYPQTLLAAEPQKSAEAAEENTEHKFIVGVGGAAELELGDGSFHPGAEATRRMRGTRFGHPSARTLVASMSGCRPSFFASITAPSRKTGR
jgi:hypothetical protein